MKFNFLVIITLVVILLNNNLAIGKVGIVTDKWYWIKIEPSIYGWNKLEGVASVEIRNEKIIINLSQNDPNNIQEINLIGRINNSDVEVKENVLSSDVPVTLYVGKMRSDAWPEFENTIGHKILILSNGTSIIALKKNIIKTN